MLAIFLIIALASLAFSILSALFGGDTGGDVHLDTSHVDTSSSGGGHDGIMFSDVLTLRTLLMFGVGFGAAGAIATNMGYGPGMASVGGLEGGCLIAALGVWFYRIIHGQQGNTAPRLDMLSGKRAMVVTDIPESGQGEVTTTNEFGTTVTLPAQSPEGRIKLGSTVEIVAVVGNTATVKRLSGVS
jgi:membrane protein implicated in regulation of membrane protease activity